VSKKDLLVVTRKKSKTVPHAFALEFAQALGTLQVYVSKSLGVPFGSKSLAVSSGRK